MMIQPVSKAAVAGVPKAVHCQGFVLQTGP